ncbi:hypothetical protein U5U50_00875 [Mycoplasma sp. 888]|uniref:hypothetical protein n=1 Tax=Mycoplasma sp. 888 TaxID=3108483 RepID=UPI002D7835F4|nr:hypothetical protein [Mycoplasma sp. 888]WRQ25940.1 hypothetical protein U5U50_00875 [Mycoplasma sp. 888]
MKKIKKNLFWLFNSSIGVATLIPVSVISCSKTQKQVIKKEKENEKESKKDEISLEKEVGKLQESLKSLKEKRELIVNKLIPFFNDFQMIKLLSNNRDIKNEYLDYQREYLNTIDKGINLLNDNSKTSYQRNNELKVLLDSFEKEHPYTSNLKDDLTVNHIIELIQWSDVSYNEEKNNKQIDLIENHGHLLKRLNKNN